MTLLIILPVVQWSPCHTVVAIPLIIAFELLLCCYLDTREGMYWFINVLILKAVDSHKPCHIFTDVSAGDNVTRVFFSDLRHIYNVGIRSKCKGCLEPSWKRLRKQVLFNIELLFFWLGGIQCMIHQLWVWRSFFFHCLHSKLLYLLITSGLFHDPRTTSRFFLRLAHQEDAFKYFAYHTFDVEQC